EVLRVSGATDALFYTYNYIKKGVVSEPDGSNTTPFFGDLCHSLFLFRDFKLPLNIMLKGMVYMKGSKRNHKKRVFSSSLGLVTIFLLGSAFAAPLNNSKSETTKHNDVVSSKVARKNAKTIKSIKNKKDQDAEKTGKKVEVEKPVVQSATKADSSDDTLSKIRSLSPSKIKTAASSESKAAEMIQSQTGLKYG
uniref:hypothetical protein n=1 Tax=Companilactobacillus furfuricola TaxID=1462575 RepID=UPI001B86E68D